MIFRAHGRAVESLGGRYITAEDVGTSPDDMEFVGAETEHVVGMQGRSGDPSPVTAWGTFVGIKAALRHRRGSDSVEGVHVAVQGLGHVGSWLCRYLADEGARLTITDIDARRVSEVAEECGAESVAPEQIYGVDADVFAPCALGAVVNDDTLEVLKAGIIAGAANNQLARAEHGRIVHERGILYAPDYVINAGGLINVFGELNDWDAERGKHKAGEIHDTLLRIFELADEEGVPTAKAADELAQERIRNARHLQRSFV
jgi:leucine dehydrogenase